MSLADPARSREGSNRSLRDEALVSLPTRTAPGLELLLRGLLALLLLLIVILLVWFDRAYYTDSYDGEVSLLDAFYYATMTLTATGYGDITPVAPHARLLNAIIVTPLRIAFLVLLVGTTLEVLAHHGRRILKDARWRKRMRNHIVVVGFGTKGRSAVETLKDNGTNPDASGHHRQPVVGDHRCERAGLRSDRRGCHPAGNLASRRSHEGTRGSHHCRPRRLGDSGHAHGAPVEPDRACRGGRTRRRQRIPAASVRCECRGDLFRSGRTAARPFGGEPSPRNRSSRTCSPATKVSR